MSPVKRPEAAAEKPAEERNVPIAEDSALDTAADSPPEPSEAGTETQIESTTRDGLIRQAAYRRYVERGEKDGDPLQDWLDAEAEVNQSFVE